MAVHSSHKDSKKLDHCWVCGAKFVQYGGTAHNEIHHVIPVAYGGIDGPTFDLCDSHHSCLHKMAVAIRARKPYHHLLGTRDPEMVRKLLWLATRVNEAEALVRNDPNKRVDVLVSLDYDTRQMLDQLLKVYPQAKGRAGLLKIAVHALHRRHFMNKPANVKPGHSR